MMRYILLLFIFLWFYNFYGNSQVASKDSTSVNKTDIEEEAANYKMYQGKYISKISFNVIDLAGPNIDDTNGKDTGIFGKIGNALHFKTKDWVVKNNLLFKEGDLVEPEKLSESERLIRNSNYAIDAKITVVPSSTSNDSVEVIVTSKDKWTITPKFSYNTQQKNSYAGFKDDNIIGLGHIVDASVTYDESKMIGMGVDLNYSAINVAGTFINANVQYEKNKKIDFKGLNLEKPLFSTETNWIGGLNIEWERNIWIYADTSGGFSNTNYRNAVQDLWGGKILNFNTDFLGKIKMVIAGRIANSHYNFDRNINPQLNNLFANNLLYIASLGFLKRNYYKDTYVEGFGHTEDIPLGSMIVLTSGIQKSNNSDRNYYGIEGLIARRMYDIGYIYLRGAFGGFRNKDKNRWEQNISNVNILYHSKLFGSSKWKYRMFLNTEYLMGFNRFDGEMVYLDTQHKLRGFNDRILHGDKKMTLNVESRIYSPFKPLGFLITGVLFTDYGMISEKGNNLFNSKLYQSYGAGIRFTNEAINKANFEVSLVYNPIYVGKSHNISVVFSGSLVLGFKEFSINKPNIFDFNNM
ncbi:MAG: hypothetical protein ACM3O3_10535 [Syntrophothermus sp.]